MSASLKRPCPTDSTTASRRKKARVERPFVYFGSAAERPLRVLSNLAAAPVTLQGPCEALYAVQPLLADWLDDMGALTFASIEHVWQALKASDRETFLRFSTTGDLGGWSADVFLKTTVVGKRAKAAKKLGRALTADDLAALAEAAMDHWKRDALVGIVAKLASNRKYGAALGLANCMVYDREFLAAETERQAWLALLRLKYTANAVPRAVLRDTGARPLVEFDKGATRRHAHWGGVMVEGRLVGDNVMGKYLEEVRTTIDHV